MKKLCYITIALVAVVGVAIYLFTCDHDAETKNTRIRLSREGKKSEYGERAVRRAIAGKIKKSSKNKTGSKKSVELFSHLPPADRRLAQTVQDALDNNDFRSVVRATEAALKSSNPEVRENAVEALGWFGAEALPELTPLMADKNDDVAEAAMNSWQLALSEIESDDTKAKIAEAAMPSLYNTDALKMIVTEITGQDDELKIMQSLVNLMQCGNEKVVAVVKEEYESMTGDAWTGFDAAEAWLQENYEPLED